MTSTAADRPAVRRLVEAPAEDVWAVLADGWSYPTWVVGAARVRAVADTWPATDSTIEHSVGTWPLLLSDETRVEECEPRRLLVLRAKGWPFGEAQVRIDLHADGGSCLVEVREDADSGPGRLVPLPVRQAAIRTRNTETLRRLALLAERRDTSGRPLRERSAEGSAEPR